MMSVYSDEDALLDQEEFAVAPSYDDVESLIEQIMNAESTWVKGDTVDAIDLGGFAWRPHLVDQGGKAVLHVHLAERLRPYLISRLKAAHESGRTVHIVLGIEALYDPEVVLALSTVEPRVYVMQEGRPFPPPQPLLAAIAGFGVPISKTVRNKIGKYAWSRKGVGEAYERGRRLEWLLAFLLSQVDDFRVVEHNFRGTTDEIDVIVQLDRISGRCWAQDGVPFILVEAKNWSKPVTQKEVSTFITKLQTKRGRSRIGLFFATSGFTSDAETQTVKLAMTDYTVVLIDEKDTENWLDSDTPDDQLETLVRRAMVD